MTGVGRAVGVLTLMVAAAGCAQAPRIEGGQIPNPPSGHGYDPNCSSARKALPAREVVRQRCWSTRREPVSSIDVTEFAGATTAVEAEAARDALAAKWTYLEYGSLEKLTIDGRPAWGWLETQRYRGEVSSREYKALVSYPERTSSIEYHHNRKPLLDAAELRAMVATFEVRTRGELDPVRAILLVGLVAAIAATVRVARRWRDGEERA